MCVFSSHSFWTSSSSHVPAGVTQEEGHTGFLINLPSAAHTFIFEEWLNPKSGIPDGYVAIIGYPSNSTTVTAPGRHLIGQRRPLPDPGHSFTGCARYWLFNSRRIPDYHAPYPIMARNTRTLRPTAHTRAIPGSCSQLSTCFQLSTATAFFQIDSLQGSRLLVSLPLSLTHNQPNRSHTQHSSCDRTTMSDSTTKLATKKAVLPRHKGLADRRAGRVLGTRQPLVHREQEQWRKQTTRLTSAQGKKEAARHYTIVLPLIA